MHCLYITVADGTKDPQEDMEYTATWKSGSTMAVAGSILKLSDGIHEYPEIVL